MSAMCEQDETIADVNIMFVSKTQICKTYHILLNCLSVPPSRQGGDSNSVYVRIASSSWSLQTQGTLVVPGQRSIGLQATGLYGHC